MNIFQAILEWSKGLKPWQQDALRRCFNKAILSKEDYEALFSMLKADHGLGDPDKSASAPIPLSVSDLPAAETPGEPITLAALSDLRNVNAIAPGQTLTFGQRGVTVIYGDNAAGKSGYARVLKHVCRSRGEEPILPNVYNSAGGNAPPEATFKYSKGGDEQPPVRWHAGAASPDDLAALSVFDRRVARICLDEAHGAVYRPYGMEVFAALADVCNELKRRIQYEQETRKQVLEALRKTLEPLFEVIEITCDTKVEEIDDATNFSEADKKEKEDLEQKLAALKAEDPEKKAADLELQVKRIASYVGVLKAVGEALSAEVAEKLDSLCEKAKSARKRVAEAAKTTFEDQPLEGVGSPEWKAFLLAAQRYSETHAYRGIPFPATEKGSLCVLCQQVLEKEAVERLQSFWKFITEDLERQAAKATQDYQEAVKEMVAKSQGEIDDRNAMEEIRRESPETADAIDAYARSLTDRRNAAIEAAGGKREWGDMPPLRPVPLEESERLCRGLAKKAEGHRKAAKPEERPKMQKRLDELAKQLERSKHRKEAKEFLVHTRDLSLLEECERATNTTGISRKATDLTNQVVSEALRGSLQDELDRIGANISVTFRTESHAGEPVHRILLAGAAQSASSPSRVLSEGEQCAVAIASFLAELKTYGHESGIILDDPVCSLDHRWRGLIARRFAEEGKTRQVVIFTHDISFWCSLVSSAEECAVPVHRQWIRRRGRVPGHNADEGPWISKTVGKRAEFLERILKEAEAAAGGDEGNYRITVRKFYLHLRDTWEQLVEELVLNKVIRRFCPEVQTRRLRDVVVDDDVWGRLNSAMSRVSGFCHDTPAAENPPPPAPGELRKDLQELRDYGKMIKDLRDAARTQRPV